MAVCRGVSLRSPWSLLMSWAGQGVGIGLGMAEQRHWHQVFYESFRMVMK